jgi:hypothetical protein
MGQFTSVIQDICQTALGNSSQALVGGGLPIASICASEYRVFHYETVRPEYRSHTILIRGVPGSLMELRNELRFGLNAPADFTWEVEGRGWARGDGITRDLSIVGAFVVTSNCPPVQTAVRVEIALPSLSSLSSAIRLLGKARVVRVEQTPGGCRQTGFAILKDDLDQWTLLSYESESSRRIVSQANTAGRTKIRIRSRRARETWIGRD